MKLKIQTEKTNKTGLWSQKNPGESFLIKHRQVNPLRHQAQAHALNENNQKHDSRMQKGQRDQNKRGKELPRT
jgi:hypothetical protein